ncbi:MAG: hypothetical protein KC657_39660 [Myxococcales bacterium]|nr:hypothetical protein [Myxococcales bacterium]
MTARGVLSAALLASLHAAVLLACTGEPVVLATLPDADDGPRGRPAPRCVVAEDCAPGTYCDRRACGDAAGTCKPFPVSCPPDELPVCGCDGVTYYSDCLRRASGQSAATPGECGENARTCRAPADCGVGGACARLGGSSPMSCGPDLVGTCWVLPPTCPPAPLGDRWKECAPPPPPGPPPPPPPCRDTCSAIRDGRPHFRALDCGG